MTTPLTNALAGLVTSALPILRWLPWLREQPRPPYTVEEAIEIDQRDDAIIEAWMERQ